MAQQNYCNLIGDLNVTLSRSVVRALLVCGLLFFYGCGHIFLPPKSSVVLFNDTSRLLLFDVNLGGRWTDMFEVKSNDLEMLLFYDDESKFTKFPESVREIKVKLDNCIVYFDRAEILSSTRKDPEGRYIWGFHINDEHFSGSECR